MGLSGAGSVLLGRYPPPISYTTRTTVYTTTLELLTKEHRSSLERSLRKNVSPRNVLILGERVALRRPLGTKPQVEVPDW